MDAGTGSTVFPTVCARACIVRGKLCGCDPRDLVIHALEVKRGLCWLAVGGGNSRRDFEGCVLALRQEPLYERLSDTRLDGLACWTRSRR